MSESTLESTDQPANHSSVRLRPGAWLFGGFLWGVAILGAFGIWFYRTQADDNQNGSIRMEVISEEPIQEEGKETQVLSSPWDENGIEDFEFTERNGEKVTRADLLGKPWVIGFIFTRCAGPCPKVSGSMKQLQKAMEDYDVRLVTLTVDPNYDKPEVLAHYAKAFSADEDKWLFLTGPRDDVYLLIQDSFNMPVREMTGPNRQPGFEVLHTSNLLLVDEQGVVQGKYNAVIPEEMAKLRRDFRRIARRIDRDS